MPRAKTPRATTPSNKQVLTMPEATSMPQPRKASPSASPQNVELEAQIRLRAYELYQERGCTPGHENEDWWQAESEVLAGRNHKQSA
jgi:hypothetical protein